MAGVSEVEVGKRLAGDVTLRDATPDDADFLAWVMLTAARSHLERGIWDFIMDADEERILDFLARLAVTEPVHWCQWSRFLIAEVDGQPAAGLCGFDPTIHGMEAYMHAVTTLAQEIMTEAEFAAGMQRGAVILSVESEPAVGAWVIENVATAPAHRRRGLVDALLDAAVDRGRQEGFSIGQIQLLLGNEPARQAYLKHGFEHADEKRSPEFEAALRSPGIERLLRTL